VTRLRERYGDDVKAVVLGRGHADRSYGSMKGIEMPGFVSIEEFVTRFEHASAFVQPTDGDSFPVASLEAMLSATPTIVTTGVGTRTLLPDEHVAEPTVEGVLTRLVALYESDEHTRRERGLAHRSCVENFTEATQGRRFASAATELVRQ